MLKSMKPLIFISNDDGIFAKGIKELVAIATQYGEVIVVAPYQNRSGIGHAVTVTQPITIKELNEIFPDEVKSYACSGMPADCVKIGIKELSGRKPNLLLSGINHGHNHSVSVFYSGTLGAAIEGYLHGIPSIAFSLMNHDADANFDFGKPYIKKLIEYGLKESVLLKENIINVNIPNHPHIKGIKVCVQETQARWKETFLKRQTPSNEDYYWLDGNIKVVDKIEGTDIAVLEEGFVSVVPYQIDLTNHQVLEILKNDLQF